MIKQKSNKIIRFDFVFMGKLIKNNNNNTCFKKVCESSLPLALTGMNLVGSENLILPS